MKPTQSIQPRASRRLSLSIIAGLSACTPLIGIPTDNMQSDASVDPSAYACGASTSCNLISTAGCGTDQVCSFASLGGTMAPEIQCIPSAMSTCPAGQIPFNDECTRLCCIGSNDACNDSQSTRPGRPGQCLLAFNGRIGACVYPENCNLASQDCTENRTCLAIGRVDVYCAGSGDLAPGARCESGQGTCSKGYYCQRTSPSEGSCFRVCNAMFSGTVSGCPSGLRCVNVPTFDGTSRPDFGICSR